MIEKELIEACKQKDRNAQRTLYDQYKRAMYTLAFRLTGDFDKANDVLQDAFIDVFNGLHKFRGESTLGAWIKTILIRKAYKQIRNIFKLEALDENLEESMGYGEQVLDSEYLEKAILELPDGYRTVFVMVEIEGYTHKEVAALLEISEGTSKSQLFYAKKRLKEYLKNEI
jgi:RNA polymerase sigma-70 factor (ECF subfamily)